MIVALSLWVYAASLAVAGTATLRGAAWVERAPRLAIMAWQALSLSIVLGVVLGFLALAVPLPQVSRGLAGLLESCAVAVQERYATAGGAAMASAGMVAAGLVVARWAYGWLAELFGSATVRRRHREMLAVVGRAQDTGVTMLDDDRPYVYCVAGRPHRIVVTHGAISRLDDQQLTAVLAHERAHLRQRHHCALAAATGMVRAFPWLGVFQVARNEITRLLELAADDAASRSVTRLNLAEAMLALSVGPPPRNALAATGTASANRIRRLIAGPRPLAGWTGLLGATATAAIVVAPLIALAAPAVTAGPDCCVGPRGERVVTVEHCPPGAQQNECGTNGAGHA